MVETSASPFNVYVRWRPPLADETSTSNIEEFSVLPAEKQAISISSNTSEPRRGRQWKSGASFSRIFPSDTINIHVFNTVVVPAIPQVLAGATCNFLAYGHSGSGKTHTIVGYDYADNNHLGLCLATARKLFEAIGTIAEGIATDREGQQDPKAHLGIGVRLYEVRGKCAYDLFNNGTECHVREGPDGRTHVRGPTESFEDGRVRVCPIVVKPCWSYDELRTAVLKGLAARATGSSSVHDESSRTHAILELEIINMSLVEAREAVTERESELVPVGKRCTDIYLEEHMKSLIRTPDGQYVPNPERPLDQARIDTAEAEKKLFEDRILEAENVVANCFRNCPHACLGGKVVFVDLAGAEYFNQANTSTAPKQTAQERLQGRQINTDLYALKEVIRARASDQARIPFRSSPLTMVLRSHFLAEEGESAMILTVSPSDNQFSATLNTLKYGDLVGAAGVTKR